MDLAHILWSMVIYTRVVTQWRHVLDRARSSVVIVGRNSLTTRRGLMIRYRRQWLLWRIQNTGRFALAGVPARHEWLRLASLNSNGLVINAYTSNGSMGVPVSTLVTTDSRLAVEYMRKTAAP
jgi:hypothetical protein